MGRLQEYSSSRQWGEEVKAIVVLNLNSNSIEVRLREYTRLGTWVNEIRVLVLITVVVDSREEVSKERHSKGYLANNKEEGKDLKSISKLRISSSRLKLRHGFWCVDGCLR